MHYDAVALIAVLATEADLQRARVIGQAMDPDSGGSLSFDTLRAMDPEGWEWALCFTPCTSDFAATAALLPYVPDMLHHMVTADFEARWPDLTPPSLEDCEAFCASVQVVAGPAQAVLAPGDGEAQPVAVTRYEADPETGEPVAIVEQVLMPPPPVLLQPAVTLESALAELGLTRVLPPAGSDA